MIRRAEILPVLEAAVAAGDSTLRAHCERALGRCSALNPWVPTKRERADSRQFVERYTKGCSR